MTITVLHGDMLKLLPTLEADSVDSVVTDPPYHLTSIVKRFGSQKAAPAKYGTDGVYVRASAGFMGKQWDGGDIAFRPEAWAEVYRVMKPGAYMLAFGGTRTYHRMACAIEDAGFEIRDQLAWMFGTGFPKSKNQGRGFGTALKPAHEPICLVRKPLSEKTVAANVLRHGTGGLNIDACRVVTADKLGGGNEKADSVGKFTNEGWIRPWMADPVMTEIHAAKVRANVVKAELLGRWPANVLHDGSDEVLAAFAAFGQRPSCNTPSAARPEGAIFGGARGQGAIYPNEIGSAARFFYSAKAGKADRAGSKHPTVKPVALIRYLVRLITPPGGNVLDPFAGSGTTGSAAEAEGFSATLIEREDEYYVDILRRLGRSSIQAAIRANAEARERLAAVLGHIDDL